MTDTGVLSDAAGMLFWNKRIQQLHGATHPTLPGLGCLPPTGGYKVQLAGLSLETSLKDFGKCQSPTTT